MANAIKIKDSLDANICPSGGEHEATDDFANDGGRYFLRICYKCSSMFAQPIPNAPPVKIVTPLG